MMVGAPKKSNHPISRVHDFVEIPKKQVLSDMDEFSTNNYVSQINIKDNKARDSYKYIKVVELHREL